MSRIFYDELLVLDNLAIKLRGVVESREEMEELWAVIDDLVHHRVLEAILDELPREHHEEFLSILADKPHDEQNLVYLSRKIEGVEDKILGVVSELEKELLEELLG